MKNAPIKWDSIYRCKDGQFNWNMTLVEFKKGLSDLKQHKHKGLDVRIIAEKGHGKSTLIDFIDSTTDFDVIDGDLLTMYARSVILDVDPSMTIGEFASSETNPWEIPIEKEPLKLMQDEVLGEFIQYFDFTTGFKTNYKPTMVLAILPEYSGYRKFLNKRIKSMLDDESKSKEWRDHIRKTHKIESLSQLNEDIAKQATRAMKSNIPFIIIPNQFEPKIDTVVWSSIIKTISNGGLFK